MKVVTFFEYYKMLKFLFNAEWISFREGMDLGDREDFLMEMDFSLGPFQEWVN